MIPGYISVCIPSRGPLVGLWATIAACELQLSGRPHEYVAIINGRPPNDFEVIGLKQDNSDFPLTVRWIEAPCSPPKIRDECFRNAHGEVVYFFDDHCIPLPGYFDEPPKDGELIHATYSANMGKYFYYHSILNPKTPLKADYSRTPKTDSRYRCISAPNGGMAVTAKTWQHIGGYGDFWQGFGGEEVFIDLKAQMMGCAVMCDPKMKYLHFSCNSEVRGYEKDFNEWNFSEGEKILRQGFNYQRFTLLELLLRKLEELICPTFLQNNA